VALVDIEGPETQAPLDEVVGNGSRLTHIAFRYYGDPPYGDTFGQQPLYLVLHDLRRRFASNIHPHVIDDVIGETKTEVTAEQGEVVFRATRQGLLDVRAE